MGQRKKAFSYVLFIFLFLSFIGTVAASFSALLAGNVLAVVLGGALSVALGIFLNEAFKTASRAVSNITKVDLLISEEGMAELEKVRKYYEFDSVESVIYDSLDISIMALEEQTKNDKILCLYDKKNNEIIAIDSMTSDGEVWKAIDGESERDAGAESDGEDEDDEDEDEDDEDEKD